MYAKLVDGVLYPAVPVLVPGEKFIFNPTEEQLLAAGYLPVQYSTPIDVQSGRKRSFKWVEKDGAIIQEWEAQKRKPTTFEIARSMVIQTADDNTALRMKSFYPEWAADTAYSVGDKVQYGGGLWRCIQAHTAIVTWEPSTATASLWEQVCETHDGTLDDPIPYSGSMALVSGKYYSQNSIIYLCSRDTEIPVYNALSDLVGLYVEEV